MAMTALQRKVALLQAGVRQSEVARSLGVSDAQVSAVVRGLHRSARVERAIAGALSRPVADVFEPVPEKAGTAA